MNFFKWFLFPISILYWFATSLRNYFYDFGVFQSHNFNIPTIGIGNITVGGTGKTPHTSYITKLICTNNKVAILSKGYGRKSRNFQYVELNSKLNSVGDEALQTKQNFPNQIVSVDHKRANGVSRILKDYPNITAIILDDVFQHRLINIGLNIVLIDFNRPIHKDYVIPMGELREPSKCVRRADCIIISKCPEGLSLSQAEEMKRRLKCDKDVFFSFVRYDKIISVSDEKKQIDFSKIKKVLLVTGIAKNKPIVDFLESKNIDVTTLKFSDHYNYKNSDIETILRKKNTIGKDTYILTTEKDIQKLKHFEKLNQQAVYYLKISVDFLWNKDKFDKKIIDYVRSNQKNS